MFVIFSVHWSYGRKQARDYWWDVFYGGRPWNTMHCLPLDVCGYTIFLANHDSCSDQIYLFLLLFLFRNS